MKGYAAVVALAAALGLSCRGGMRAGNATEAASLLFYSDLGPDTIDVSSYPEERRRQYAVFQRVCSQCHTPARAINSPVVSRGFWEMYVLAMRRRSGYAPTPYTSLRETEDIVDFLDYDSQVRKVGRPEEFAAQQRELKRRFEQLTRPSR